jgi:hypothetical protein
MTSKTQKFINHLKNLQTNLYSLMSVLFLILHNQSFHQNEVLYEYFMKMSELMPILRLCVGVRRCPLYIAAHISVKVSKTMKPMLDG